MRFQICGSYDESFIINRQCKRARNGKITIMYKVVNMAAALILIFKITERRPQPQMQITKRKDAALN